MPNSEKPRTEPRPMTEERFTLRMRHAALMSFFFCLGWWVIVFLYVYFGGLLPSTGLMSSMLMGWIVGLAFPPFMSKRPVE
jgi:hypothetical protein